LNRIIGITGYFLSTELRQFLLITLLIIPFFASTQTIVAGFEGLEFTRKPESYQLQLKDSFNLHQMKLTPVNLTLAWSVENNSFWSRQDYDFRTGKI
jgi:hypothetical protein